MSYAEKPEDITREEWMDKLNNVHIQRADMNRLIMNYLVTGEVTSFFVVVAAMLCYRLSVKINCVEKCCARTWTELDSPPFPVQQRASRRQQRNSGWSLE